MSDPKGFSVHVPGSRKVVFVAVGEQYHTIALCNDGTLWEYGVTIDGPQWKRLAEIPQDTPTHASLPAA